MGPKRWRAAAAGGVIQQAMVETVSGPRRIRREALNCAGLSRDSAGAAVAAW
jgi:hypothetical protein